MDSLATLTTDTVLLTVNKRLARALLDKYARQQMAAGRKAWTTPRILPWSAWLVEQYVLLIDRAYTDKTLLSPHQERLLWEQVVKESEQGSHLLRPRAAARTAQQAWQLLHDWRLPPEALAHYPHEETRLFLAWAERFDTLCAQARALSSAELGALLIGAVDEAVLAPPTCIRLAGFDSLTPLQQRILEGLSSAGCDVADWQETGETGTAYRLALQTRELEYLAAANWARQRIAQHPDTRLAIVSPHLETDRPVLERILRQVLDPGGYLPGHSPAPLFNISVGQALSEYPLAAHLLLALRLSLGKPLALHEIGVLLRSPFIGGHATEWAQRAALDRQLRELGQPYLSPRDLLHHARRLATADTTACPDLIERLKRLQQQVDALPAQDSPNTWAGHLLGFFDTLGWPGDRPLESREYQQAERLRRAVSEFSTLARIRTRFHLDEAISRFTQLCEEIDYQPQVADTPLQALGMLEAAGQHFDAVWVLGMDDASWPPAPSPNPLLPVSLQREREMPHASATRELAFAGRLLDRLCKAAPEVIFSHALQDRDSVLRASPLIQAYTSIQPDDLQLETGNPLYDTAPRDAATVPLPVTTGVPLGTPPRGGSALLADQAACPFKATARHRLAARPLAEPGHAPDPRLVGGILHQLLERVWQHLQDSQTLRRYPPDELAGLVDTLAGQVLTDLGRQRPDLYHPTFSALEQERLGQLTLSWLAYEGQRERPFRVLACEEQVEQELAGLPLDLRVDRIDELEDGSRVIIDYKTGSRVDASSWTGERPGEPQVPLYCLGHAQVAAAVLAQVHQKHIKMHGLAREGDILPGIPAFQGEGSLTDWNALLEHWRSQLEVLATEILDGLAEVRPADENACQYCELPALCRVSLVAAEDQDEVS